MPRSWIALGGNLGDVADSMRQALQACDARGLIVVRSSRLFDTTPVGSASSDRYLNAAAELDAVEPAEALLDHLQAIERLAGRTRTERWGPRTLDLDLLFYGDSSLRTPRLTVPHPALWYRRFVLDPLADIAPDLRHPEFDATIGELRSRLLQRPLPVYVQPEGSPLPSLTDELDRRFGEDLSWIDDPAAAVIAFDTRKTPPAGDALLPNHINLASAADPIQLARDILTAALDEPQLLDQPL